MCEHQQKRRALVRLTGEELAREAAAAVAAWLATGTAEAEAYKELCWYEALSRGRADLYLRGVRLATAGLPYTGGGVPR
jgi:phage portal protein BeeE